MGTLKVFFIVCAVLTVIAGSMVLKTLRDAGEFKKIEPHFKGQCKVVTGVASSEDITIHPQTVMAFISSDDRRPLFRGGRGRQGAIFAYDLKAVEPQLVNLTGDFTHEFHPHGIGLFVGQDGDTSLFVVNHRTDGHFVEIFEFRNNGLVHRESIGGDLMHSPNDVVPVGPRSFYVTNDHGNSSRLGRTLEEYLQLARSYVLYYDGNRFRKAAEGLAYANGINMSRDGKILFVAATVGRKVYVYERDKGTGDLKLLQTIYLGTGVDNIEVDEKGHLWIGAHPKLLTFVTYSKNHDELSPSQVLRVVIQGSGSYQADEIYLSEGRELSGASVGAVFQDTLLIGSVFDPRFLLCKYQ
ncbi:MAG: SMP-30/gluconolactonase/LRE family protein [Pseudomonadota bacterium]